MESSASEESITEVVENVDQKLVNVSSLRHKVIKAYLQNIRDYIYAKRLNSALYNALGREDATAILKVYYRMGAWSPCPTIKCSPRSERLYRSDDMQVALKCFSHRLLYKPSRSAKSSAQPPR